MILSGVILTVVGLVFNVLSKTGIPVLPGDIYIKNERVTVYFPIITSVILSIILTVIVNLFRRK